MLYGSRAAENSRWNEVLPIVSSEAKTPCIQQVAHIVVSSSSMPWPVRRIAPWRRASVAFLVAQDDVAVVRAVRHEERDQAAARPLLCARSG